MKHPLLSATNLSKTYLFPEKLTILSGISLTLNFGESLAICGRSGEGKTTLLHILGTLEAPDTGTLHIHNTQITAKNAPLLRSRHIGFIFQSYNLLEDFTSLENVLMPARIARLPTPLSYGLHLLSLVGLENKAHHPVKLLSGGERQRIAIARALCNNPDLLLADEPSGNLDSTNAHAIIQLLLSLTTQQNKSLLLVTHDPTLAALCNRQHTLHAGALA